MIFKTLKKKIHNLAPKITKSVLSLVMAFMVAGPNIMSVQKAYAAVDLNYQARTSLSETAKIYNLWGDNDPHAYRINIGGESGFCLDMGKSMSSGLYMDRTGRVADSSIIKILNWYYNHSSNRSNYRFWLAQTVIWGLQKNKISIDTLPESFKDIWNEMDKVYNALYDTYCPGDTIGPDLKDMVEESSSGTYYTYSYSSGYQRIATNARGNIPTEDFDSLNEEETITATQSNSVNITKTDSKSGKGLAGVTFDFYRDGTKIGSSTTNSNGVATYTYSRKISKTATSGTKYYVINWNQLSPDNKEAYSDAGYYSSKSAAQNAAEAEAKQKAQALVNTELAKSHSFYAIETSTKTLYWLNPNKTQTNTVSVTGNNNVNLTLTNDYQTGTINLKKSDEQTSNGVAGAVYELYAAEPIVHPDGKTGTVYTKNALVGTFPATDSNGQTSLSGLYLGKYYVKEKNASPNYVLDTKTYNVELTYAGTNVPVVTSSVSVKEQQIRGELTINKLDSMLVAAPQSESNKVIVDGNNDGSVGDATLKGATYGIYASNTINHPDGHSGVVTYTSSAGNSQMTLLKGSDLQVMNTKAEAGALLATVKTDSNGQISIGNLYLGEYYVKEISPSTGYLLDTTVYNVSVTTGGQTLSVIKDEISVCETPIYQAFEIQKYGSDNKTSKLTPLGNVEFTVKLNSDVESMGWNNAPTYDVLVTNEKGQATSKELPYGVYLVRETYTPDEFIPADDFTVTVSEDSRIPQDYTRHTIINDEFTSLLKVVKADKETGKTIAIAHTQFKIKNLDTNEYVGYWSYYPTPNYTDVWATNDEGYLILNEVLDAGNYELIEVRAPHGYLLPADTITFRISSNADYELAEDGVTPLITITQRDEAVKGQITVEKKGEVLVGFENGQFIYEERGLANAEYNIYANENIMDPSNDGTVLYAKDTLIQTVITGTNGKATSELLPLGSYYVLESKAPYGTILNTEKKVVDLVYKDQVTPIVTNSVSFVNERQKLDINAIKKDADTDAYVAGAEVTLYTKQDIITADGTVLFKEGDSIRTIMTNTEGTSDFGTDLPLVTYHIMETKAPLGYALNSVKFNLDGRYRGQDLKVIELTNIFINKPTVVEISKQDITTGVEVAGNVLSVTDSKGNVIDSWISVQGESHIIKYLHVGETYTLKEILAASGYLQANEIQFTIRDTEEVQRVVMKDELAKGQITVEKTGEVLTGYDSETQQFIYEEKSVPGAHYELYAGEDIKHPDNESEDFYKKGDLVNSGETDENGQLIFKDLPLGQYILIEKQAPNGLVCDSTPKEISLAYQGQTVKVVYANETQLNTRQKVVLDLHKYDVDTLEPVVGAEFTIYANKDIKDYLGNVIVTKDTIIAIGISDENGDVNFNIDLPVDVDNMYTYGVSSVDNDAMFYLKETGRPFGYTAYNAIIYLNTSYQVEQPSITLSCNLYNKITETEFSKTDITSGKPVPGAELIVRDENNQIIDSWITLEDNPDTPEDESIHLIKGLEPGEKYTLEEKISHAALLGYVTAEKVEFTITDEEIIHQVEMKDDYTKVEITKTDIATDDPVIGAELSIIPVDDEGNVLVGETWETWITDENPHYITKLPIGNYILRERLQGEAWDSGYVTANDVPFTVRDTNEIQKVNMDDDYTKVEIYKLDKETGNYVYDAMLSLIPVKEDGTLDLGAAWETWLTTGKAHYIERIPVGKYVLRETLGLAAQYGYITADDMIIEVKDTSVLQKFIMEDDFTKVKINKVNSKNYYVSGATLQLTPLDDEGNPLYGESFASWLTEDKSYYIDHVPFGKYLVTELSAPDGYVKASPMVIEILETGEIQEFTMVDKQIIINKVDATGKPLAGAVFEVIDKDGNVVDTWTSGQEPHYVSGLVAGETYTLKEVKSPEGFNPVPEMQFTVFDDGKNQEYTVTNTRIVKTGDTSHILPYVALSGITSIGFITLLLMNKKKKESEAE